MKYLAVCLKATSKVGTLRVQIDNSSDETGPSLFYVCERM